MSMRVGLSRRFAPLSVDLSHVDDPEHRRFGRTQQSFKDDADVNLIMKRFEKTGMIDHLNEFQGQYGDFLDVPQSYHDAVNQVLAADAMFMTIPAKVRERFGNDPGRFLAFVDDPANVDEMVSLGLARRSEPPVEEPAFAPEASPVGADSN